MGARALVVKGEARHAIDWLKAWSGASHCGRARRWSGCGRDWR
jgi:hypothetical protein